MSEASFLAASKAKNTPTPVSISTPTSGYAGASGLSFNTQAAANASLANTGSKAPTTSTLIHEGKDTSINAPDTTAVDNTPLDTTTTAPVNPPAVSMGPGNTPLVGGQTFAQASAGVTDKTALGALAQKYQNAHIQTQTSGIGSPPTQGQSLTETSKNAPITPPVDTSVDAALAEDKGYQQLLKDQKEYRNTVNQQTSLLDFYNQSIKDAGIPAINAELLNSKNIIDGTEDHIRAEVQAVNGFATDSQVLALANARNKQLVKNYNNLLDAKSMAMESINTMVGLKKEDQATALQNITQKMNIDEQLNTYRDKFVNNAKEGYNNYIKAAGYDGLYTSLVNSGDPKAISTVEKTLGLPSGGLAVAAQQAIKARTLADTKSGLENQALQANINQSKASAAKSYSDMAAAKASDAAVNPDVLQGMLNVYKSTGVLPAFGMSAKSPLRAQFYAALGGAGGSQIVSDANTNKAVRGGLTTAYRTQQNLYSANQTAVNTLDKQLTLAQSYKAKVSDAHSPLLNKYKQSIQSGVFGDPDVAALHNIVTTASYEFAKILSGASASIAGVTVSSQADAESMLNSAMSNGQFNEVVGLMRKEAGFRLNTQKDTLTQLQGDLNNVGNLTDSLKPVAPSDIPNGYYQASDGLLYKK